jgi:hypothetical protein
VVKAPGTVTLTMVPQELPCNGVQLVQIPAPKTRGAPAAGDRQGTAPMLTNYYLEMRAPLGFDAGLGPMVVVSIGPDFAANNRAAPYVYTLDMAPTTTTLNDSGLKAGQSFTDPAGGLTIAVNSISAQSASVTITTSGTGAPTCGDGTAFTAPGPDATSCGALVGGGATGGAGGSTTGAAGAGGGAGGAGGGTVTGAAGAGGTRADGGAAGAGGTTTTTGAAGSSGGGGTTTADAGGGHEVGASGGCSCSTAAVTAPGAISLAWCLVALGTFARRGSRRRRARAR